MSTKAERSEAAAMLGRRKSEAKTLAARENAKLGGRPSSYRRTRRGLERLVEGHWRVVPKPYDAAARQYLTRLRQAG